MKKIINFLKEPFTTHLFVVCGLVSGFSIGVIGKQLIDLQSLALQKGRACQEAYDVMCVQVHTCTDTPVSDCDQIVSEKEVCRVNLPDIQVIFECKEELRHIQCDGDLPISCSLFMDLE